MTRTLRPFSAAIAVAAAALALVAPRDAAACFDGYTAAIGKVSLMRSLPVASWSPDDARHVARWGARIDALVPAGAHLDVISSYVSCTSASGACGSVTEIDAGSADLRRLFQEVGTAFGASPGALRAAQRIEPALYTVQIFAGSERGAKAMKKRVADLGAGAHGFYEAGGFPSVNDTAHVLRDSTSGALHRVVVGVFLSKADAEAALAEMRAQGLTGFTRDLPPGTPVAEAQRSREG